VVVVSSTSAAVSFTRWAGVGGGIYLLPQADTAHQDGRIAYSGKAAGALANFESLGLLKPSKVKVAEFLLRWASSPVDFWDSSGGETPASISSPAAPGLLHRGFSHGFQCLHALVLTIVFAITGCCVLHPSPTWFGRTTKRYQVASGMSLAAPPWYKSQKVLESGERATLKSEQPSDEQTPIPAAPRTHLKGCRR
jgi:hypothetical protein